MLLHLELALQRPTLAVGERLTLTALVFGDGDSAAGTPLELTLTLPKGVASSDGQRNKVTWSIAAPASGSTLTQQVVLQVEKPKQALKAGVGKLELRISGPGYEAQKVSALLGITPAVTPRRRQRVWSLPARQRSQAVGRRRQAIMIQRGRSR